jgi:hypothetical protein
VSVIILARFKENVTLTEGAQNASNDDGVSRNSRGDVGNADARVLDRENNGENVEGTSSKWSPRRSFSTLRVR